MNKTNKAKVVIATTIEGEITDLENHIEWLEENLKTTKGKKEEIKEYKKHLKVFLQAYQASGKD